MLGEDATNTVPMDQSRGRERRRRRRRRKGGFPGFHSCWLRGKR